MPTPEARQHLGEILQLAHSGELAAIYAYRGHAKSVSDAAQRTRIVEIERDEAEHRLRVRAMLDEIEITPSRRREAKLALIGRILGFLCHLGGWFVPMYGAGR